MMRKRFSLTAMRLSILFLTAAVCSKQNMIGTTVGFEPKSAPRRPFAAEVVPIG